MSKQSLFFILAGVFFVITVSLFMVSLSYQSTNVSNVYTLSFKEGPVSFVKSKR